MSIETTLCFLYSVFIVIDDNLFVILELAHFIEDKAFSGSLELSVIDHFFLISWDPQTVHVFYVKTIVTRSGDPVLEKLATRILANSPIHRLDGKIVHVEFHGFSRLEVTFSSFPSFVKRQ